MSRQREPHVSELLGLPLLPIENAIDDLDARGGYLIHETALPVQTLGMFLTFLGTTNILSNNQRTTLPILCPEDFTKFITPYNTWAPPPYNQNPIRTEAALFRLTTCFTGFPDFSNIQALLTSASDISQIDLELEINRLRFWAGIQPISSRRWSEKRLDDPENIELAVEYLLKACLMSYFSLPSTARKMRDAYNRAYDICAQFDTVLAAYYAANPSTSTPSPSARVADLWADWFFTHIQFISSRTHSWATDRLDRLVQLLLERLETAPADKINHDSPLLWDIARRVDTSTLIPLVGFKNPLPQWKHVTSPPIINWSAYIASNAATPLRGNYPSELETREHVYGRRLGNIIMQQVTPERMREHLEGYIRRREQAGGLEGYSASREGMNSEGATMGMRMRWEWYYMGRWELWGGKDKWEGEEMWVREVKRGLGVGMEVDGQGTWRRRVYSTWGFVGYRLWYGHTEEEWVVFKRKFEEDVKNWGEGVEGAEDVKHKVEIWWIDGREEMIAEGDVEAARRHYKGLKENQEAGMRGLNAPGFLVADKECIDVYLHRGLILPGQDLVDEADLGPWVRVGTEEDVHGGARTGEGYDGTVRVLGSMLLDDIWPCLAGRHVDLQAMWKMARTHPMGVYIGPLVQSRVDGWDRLGEVEMAVVKGAIEWKREGGSGGGM